MKGVYFLSDEVKEQLKAALADLEKSRWTVICPFGSPVDCVPYCGKIFPEFVVEDGDGRNFLNCPCDLVEDGELSLDDVIAKGKKVLERGYI